MTDQRCATCKWWQGGKAPTNPPDAPTNDLWGTCARTIDDIRQYHGPASKALAFPEWSDDGRVPDHTIIMAKLNTAYDFGCTQWAAKEPPQFVVLDLVTRWLEPMP